MSGCAKFSKISMEKTKQMLSRFSDMVGHDVGHAGADECKLDDERVGVGRGANQVVPQNIMAVLFADFLGGL